MRKVTKISAKVLFALVASAVGVPFVLSLLLAVPAVQNGVVHLAARKISARLETEVRIGRVDIGWLGKVHVHDFYVEDYQRDTLIYVDHLDAYVTGLGIFGGGIGLSRAEMIGARLCLRETPEGVMNIKQVVARLSDPDKPKKGNFRLSLSKASIEDMELCIERTEHRNPPYGIDFADMHLSEMSARVEDFTIDGQTIYADIARFSARERSGFRLDHLSGRFYLTSGCMGFEQARLVTERSHVWIPYFSLAGDSWAEYKDFTGTVRIDGALRRSTLSTDDVAYFSPRLRDWHLTASEIDIELAGEVDDLRARILGFRLGDGTSLVADATVEGLPDIARARFDVDLKRLSTSAADIDRLAAGVGGRDLSERLVGMLDNSGRIDLGARFRGTLSSFDVRADVASAVGDLDLDVRMSPRSDGSSRVVGDLRTRNLRLGDLVGRRDLLGDASLEARIDGRVGHGRTDAALAGNVTRLAFNGYTYDSLRLDGRLTDRRFDGRITARDPNLVFDFAGLVDLNDTVPRYDFSLALDRADLARLHINRRDSVSVLSARIAAQGSGRTLDDMNGTIRITDADYRYNDRSVAAQRVVLTGENSARSKFVELRSDFADVTFRSKTSYRTVFEYLRRSARRYLPTLRAARGSRAGGSAPTAVADDYSLLSVLVRDFNPVADAVSPGLQIADSSSMQLLFNPANDRLSFSLRSGYVERRRMLATHLKINASNRGDSLTLYGSAEDLYAGMFHLPRFSVTGGAKQGAMRLTAGFADSARRLSGRFGLFARAADDGAADSADVAAVPARRGVAAAAEEPRRALDLYILPSHLTRGDKSWQIRARRIRLDTARVEIDRFHVSNREQELLLDGVASRSLDDSLTLTLRNFDLAPFAQVADRMGYSVEGRTDGRATMRSVLLGGELSADIAVDSLSVNGIEAPPLRLVSRWDFARNRAGVTVTNRQKRDTLVRGFYAPAQQRYYARLAVDSLDMGLLDPVLSGVISGTRGLASADLTVQGRGREADLTGRIRARDLSTRIDFTQVRYTVPEAELRVENNRFRVQGATLRDSEGNSGRLDLDLDLKHLSNIGYELRVSPREMLVLNTTSLDNDLFYGRVYATGEARIRGDKGGVRMEVSASTDDNSTFFMPLSGKSNISYADFVTFVEPPQAEQDIVTRKKLSFERRRSAKAEGGSQMEIALALDVRPNVEVELTVSGNTLKARGAGVLNLSINPRTNLFEMYGDYTLSEGSFQLSLQNIINKRFVIEDGSTIQWTGSPMDALLNIEAVYKLKASLQPLLQGTSDRLTADRSVPVECVIRLGDRLTNPAIAFDVRVPGSDPETQAVVANALASPETVDTQFAYLLMFNSFMAENGAGANLGASVSASTGLELVSNMVSNMLSRSDYGIVLRYRPKSELTSDEVDFGLSKSLIDNRLFVEVEGNYLIDNKQAVNSSMSNFMGEAYVTYLIDRSGTLRLKAFTQTIDRFDENQGLQETGVGIYFKQDFNNFRDFRCRVKERFTNRKRQERRAARRAAKEREELKVEN